MISFSLVIEAEPRSANLATVLLEFTCKPTITINQQSRKELSNRFFATHQNIVWLQVSMEDVIASEKVESQEEVHSVEADSLNVNAHVLAKLSDHLTKILASRTRIKRSTEGENARQKGG